MGTETLSNPDSTAFVPPSFWMRVAAFNLDVIILNVLSQLLGIVHLPMVWFGVMSLAYYTGFFCRNHGQTPGKQAAGVQVIRMDGSPIGYGHAFLRWMGYLPWITLLFMQTFTAILVCFVLALMGFLIVFIDGRRRSLPDYIANTRVIQAQAVAGMKRTIIFVVGVGLPALAFGALLMAFLIPLAQKAVR
jgi:uncharacterized RDD family membrane protein YckC